ncbi:TonB-dependent receptor [Halosquirtibacter xylanolyticus]|uniref:TonB-dependent receptor n=1 Tax=Halosquirtibacter xylanolyticus TaxID=3374599 RepID=UPI003748E839|nr:TonB-dependent receptor [Prolixibacteraceae bacterium]
MNIKFFSLLIGWILIGISTHITAQERTDIIKGTVVDQAGQAIPSVVVISYPSGLGTTTNANGNFSINIKDTDRYIEFKMMGFENQRLLRSRWSNPLQVTLVSGDENLDEVVITAGRSKETLNEVPGAISIVSKRVLSQQLGVTTNLNEVLANSVPGMAPSSQTSSNWGQTLRGRNVLVMVDGVPQSTPLRNGQLGIRSIDPNVISRVEVIKGATAIYGNGAEGGIVNYITQKSGGEKKISSKTVIRGSQSLVSPEDSRSYSVQQMFYGTVGKFRYLVNGGYEKTGLFKDADGDIIGQIYGLSNNTNYNIFGKLGYDFTSKSTLEVMANRYQSKQGLDYTTEAGGAFINSDGEYELKKAQGKSGEQPGVSPGVVISNITASYSHQDIFSGSHLNVDGYYQKAENIFFYSKNFENGGQSEINSEKMGLRPHIETTLSLFDTSTLRLLYGLDLLNDKTSQDLVDGRHWTPVMDMLSVAPYLQASLRIKEAWMLKGGVRYENMSVRVPTYKTLPYSAKGDGVFSANSTIQGGTLRYDNVTFNAGLRYIAHDSFRPYFSYSQGFSVSDLGRVLRYVPATKAINSIDDISTEPVITDNYELGFSSHFGIFKMSASGFLSTSEMGSSLVFDKVSQGYVNKRQPQTIFGYEVTADLKLCKKLMVGGSYSFTEGLYADDQTKSISYIPNTIISAPKSTAYIDYQPIEKLSLHMNVLHVGQRDRFAANDKGLYAFGHHPVKDAYTVIDLLGSYQCNSHLKLMASVKNLLNTDYFPARSQWGAFNGSYIIKGEGLTMQLGLEYTL